MTAPGDELEMEKMAEDELAKLQRQFRVMEAERDAVGRSARPGLRKQRAQLQALSAQLHALVDKTQRAPPRASRDRLRSLLAERDRGAARVSAARAEVAELDFLARQVRKEIERLRVRGPAPAGDPEPAGERAAVARLENRLGAAVTKLDSVNGENYAARLRIDRLLRDRRFFDGLWRARARRLADGEARVAELVEQAIGTHDQREEWGARLAGLEERAAVDRRRHELEVRELRRRLDRDVRLERFLRTKGTVRLTAADARAEARQLERREAEARAHDAYAGALDALKAYAGEDDVERIVQEFTRREEENYALFNYVNEINGELKTLSDDVAALEADAAREHAARRARLARRSAGAEALRAALAERREARERLRDAGAAGRRAAAELPARVRRLAEFARCDALPLLKLLGGSLEASENNARLYIASLERRAAECAEDLRAEERAAEARDRPAPSRRRRRPEPSPRR